MFITVFLSFSGKFSKSIGGSFILFFKFHAEWSATSKTQPFILFVHPFKHIQAHQIFLRARDLVDCVRVACKGTDGL